MKWKRKIAVVLSALFLSTSSAPAGDMLQFMEDTMKSLTTVTPKAYQGQERGYFIGGSASIRFPNENIQPFSFTPPQLKAGCGGIDIIMGGFSYLNFDYLVQKLQQILQVAPAFAFELALSTMCEKCTNILSSLDNLANQINTMNINQCRAAKAVVGFATVKAGIISSLEQSDGSKESWFSSIKDAVSNLNSAIEKYSNLYDSKVGNKDASKTFSFQPTLLHNAFEKAGAYTYLEPFVRALIGDYNEEKSEDENTNVPNRIPPCVSENLDAKAILDGLMYGIYTVRNIDSNGKPLPCQQVVTTPFVDQIRNTIACIGYKMQLSLGRSATAPGGCSGTSLTAEELSLINNLEIPIISFLKSAIVLDDPAVYDTTIEKLTKVAALQIAYLSFSRLAGIAQSALANYEGQSIKLTPKAKEYFQDLGQEMMSLKRETYRRYFDELNKVRTTYGNFLQKQLELKLAIYKTLKEHNLLQNYLFQTQKEGY